jgi:hypothetical protein
MQSRVTLQVTQAKHVSLQYSRNDNLVKQSLLEHRYCSNLLHNDHEHLPADAAAPRLDYKGTITTHGHCRPKLVLDPEVQHSSVADCLMVWLTSAKGYLANALPHNTCTTTLKG